MANAYLWKKDAQEIAVPERSVAEQPEFGEGLSDMLMTRVQFEGAREGTVAVLDVEVETDLGKRILPWSAIVSLAPWISTEEYQVEMLGKRLEALPNWRIVAPGTTQSMKQVGRTGAQALIVRKRLKPPKVPEVGIATWLQHLPYVVISQADSWEQIAKKIEQLIAPHGRKSAAKISALAKTLTQNAETPDYQLRALEHFVAHEIRYVSDDRGRDGTRARDPGETLQRRYGDCKDKSALYVALARSLGLPAYPVLVVSRRELPDSAPLPATAYFDHMIGCVSEGEDQAHCFDPTTRMTDPLRLSVYTRGTVGLRALGPEYLHFLPRESHAYELSSKAYYELQLSSTILVQLEEALHGAIAQQFRMSMSDLSADRQEQSLKSRFESTHGSYESCSVTAAGLEAKSDGYLPVTVETNAVLALTNELKDKAKIFVPDLALDTELRRLKTGSYEYQSVHDGYLGESRIEIRIPEGFRLLGLPPTVEYKMPLGEMTRAVSMPEPNLIIVETRVGIAQTTEEQRSQGPGGRVRNAQNFLIAALA